VEKEVKILKKYLFLLAIVLLISPAYSVETELEIPLSAPILIKLIPNQAWPANTPLLNAFDLDEHFIDNQNFPLTFFFDSVDNISVTINADNQVSFFPEIGFIGTRKIVFYASNGIFNTSSNEVYLYVGSDTEAPKWSQPIINRVTVYQNSMISFSTSWTDNLQLKKYIFSINQGSGWVNYSEEFFSGTSNNSIKSVQISAPGGTAVQWVFYAWDTTLNLNVTDVQSFNVSTRIIPQQPSPPGRGGGAAGLFGAVSPSRTDPKSSNFSVSPEFLILTLRKNKIHTTILTIRNTGSEKITLTISEDNLNNLVMFSEKEFLIEPGEVKEITVDFNPEKFEVGQYFGYIVVESLTESKYIPVIVDIKEEESKFDLVVEVHSKTHLPGQEVSADISLLNLYELSQKTGILVVAIKDINGNVYDTSEEEIDFSEITKFTKTLSLPEEVQEGLYIFYARVTSSEATAISSDSFEVGIREFYLAIIKPFFLIFLLILLAIIFSILMIKYKRYKDRERILALYFMLMNLKELIEKEKLEEAIELYILIKSKYSESVPKNTIENKKALKEEIRKILISLKEKMPKKIQENLEEITPSSKEDSGDEKEESKKSKTEKNGPEISSSETKKENEEPKKEESEKSEKEESKLKKEESKNTGEEKPTEKLKKENDLTKKTNLKKKVVLKDNEEKKDVEKPGSTNKPNPEKEESEKLGEEKTNLEAKKLNSENQKEDEILAEKTTDSKGEKNEG
jgi:hypothetical protein